MGKYEVSYKEYFTFLNELKNSGNTELYEICKIDSMAADSFVTNGRYGKFYIKEHTLIQNCPVSNISFEAAIAFCKWTTDNYNNDPKRKFHKVQFRLPTEKEWMYAAKGGWVFGDYSWGSPFLRNYHGEFLANFNRVGQEAVTYNETTKKYDLILKKVLFIYLYRSFLK